LDAVEADAIAQKVRQVQDRIERAARRVGRDPQGIRLVAVTKSVDPSRIRAALDAGVRIIGENRLQEALPKIEALGSGHGHTWHFIGQLQRRKVKTVLGQFDMIQSVDTIELAAEIQRCAEAAGVTQPVLLEVNIGGEPSKAGFSPDVLPTRLAVFETMSHVAVKGLMTIPPRGSDAESVRPYFRQLRELAGALGRQGFPHIEMSELSMGMSQDYEVAVEEGATFVRVGTAIFGGRGA
jgi:pyridoxal phosphate enzyme (YggS family)